MNYKKYIFTLFLMTLLSNQYSLSFPIGKCTPSDCSESPYDINWVDNINRNCFIINDKTCLGKFCNDMKSNLQEILIKINPQCKDDFSYITLNGTQKTLGVYFDLYKTYNTAELRITSLHTNITKIKDNVFCLLFKPDSQCHTDIEYRHTGKTMDLSIYDTVSYKYCPVCKITLNTNDKEENITQIINASVAECPECPIFTFTVCDTYTNKSYVNPCIARCLGVPINRWTSGICHE